MLQLDAAWGERMPKWCPGCPTKRCSNPSTGILRIALSARLVLWVSLACTLAAAAAGRCIIEATMLRQTGRLQSAHSCKVRLCARTTLLRLQLRLYHLVTVTCSTSVWRVATQEGSRFPSLLQCPSSILVPLLSFHKRWSRTEKLIQKCTQIGTHEKHS